MQVRVFTVLCLYFSIGNLNGSCYEPGMVEEIANDFSVNPKKAFKKFNEGSYFIEHYERVSPEKPFSELSQQEYETFKSNLSLFEGTPEKKVADLLFFARLVGCPVLALSQSRKFFYDARHIVSPREINILDRDVEVFPYEGDFVGIRNKGDKSNASFRIKEISPDLKENAIIYNYHFNLGQEEYSSGRATHYSRHGIAKLSYDFLGDYIMSPYTIARENTNYMARILSGLRKLPKAAVNLMRGKAIYISSEDGNSGAPFVTSHNAPIISYLGLIPGIFIESNSVTNSNIVLMVGHLIEQTVFEKNRPWTLASPPEESDLSVDFPYQFVLNIGPETKRSFREHFTEYVCGAKPRKHIKRDMEEFCSMSVSSFQDQGSYPITVTCSKDVAQSSSSSSAQ